MLVVEFRRNWPTYEKYPWTGPERVGTKRLAGRVTIRIRSMNGKPVPMKALRVLGIFNEPLQSGSYVGRGLVARNIDSSALGVLCPGSASGEGRLSEHQLGEQFDRWGENLVPAAIAGLRRIEYGIYRG